MPDDLLHIIQNDPAARAQAQAAAKLMRIIDDIQSSPLGLYRQLFTDEKGNPIKLSKFHYEWNDIVMEQQCALIEASRGLTKTSFILAYILWRIGHNQNIRIKILCEGEDAAKKRLNVVDQYIQQSKLYQLSFPNIMLDKKEPNNANVLTLQREIKTPEATVEAMGILSAGTGSRCDEMILDDIVGESNAILNPSLQPKVLSKLLNDWLPTLSPSGGVKGIFTPWAKTDANEYLKKNTGWFYKRYAHGTADDPYHSIFPELWPKERLISRRLWVGPVNYARQYLCRHPDKEISIVQPSYLTTYTNELDTLQAQQAILILSVDPSSGKAQKGKGHKELDPLGFTLFVYLPPEEVIQVELEQHTTYTSPIIRTPLSFQAKIPAPLQANFIDWLAQHWQVNHVLVEAQGAQTLDQWLTSLRVSEEAQNPDRHTYEIHAIPAPRSKGQRLMQVLPILAASATAQSATLQDPRFPRLYFHPATIQPNPAPQHIQIDTILDPDTQIPIPIETLCDLREQLLGFPGTRHDDILDSFTQGLIWISKVLLDAELPAASNHPSEEQEGMQTQPCSKKRNGKGDEQKPYSGDGLAITFVAY